MIEVLFRKCCENCPYISVEHDSVSGFTARITTIGCSHMNVCGQYLQEDTPDQYAIVKGVADADR